MYKERYSRKVGRSCLRNDGDVLGSLNEQLLGEFCSAVNTHLRENGAGCFGLDDSENLDGLPLRHLFESGSGFFRGHGLIHLGELSLALSLLILPLLGDQGFPFGDKLFVLDLLLRGLFLM